MTVLPWNDLQVPSGLNFSTVSRLGMADGGSPSVDGTCAKAAPAIEYAPIAIALLVRKLLRERREMSVIFGGPLSCEVMDRCLGKIGKQ